MRAGPKEKFSPQNLQKLNKFQLDNLSGQLQGLLSMGINLDYNSKEGGGRRARGYQQEAKGPGKGKGGKRGCALASNSSASGEKAKVKGKQVDLCLLCPLLTMFKMR